MLDEESKSAPKVMLAAIAMLIVLVGVAVILVNGFIHVFSRPESAPVLETFKGPQLETFEGEVLREVQKTEDSLLEHYAWSDRARGRVRIPIRRAMEVLAKEGGEN